MLMYPWYLEDAATVHLPPPGTSSLGNGWLRCGCSLHAVGWGDIRDVGGDVLGPEATTKEDERPRS